MRTFRPARSGFVVASLFSLTLAACAADDQDAFEVSSEDVASEAFAALEPAHGPVVNLTAVPECVGGRYIIRGEARSTAEQLQLVFWPDRTEPFGRAIPTRLGTYYIEPREPGKITASACKDDGCTLREVRVRPTPCTQPMPTPEL